jgi:predicted esterase
VLAAGQEPVKVQVAQREFNEAYRQGDWVRAIEVGHELVTMLPGRPVLLYNLACVYALDGDTSAALLWLDRAAADGFFAVDQLETDADLDAVRDRPGYAKVRAIVEANQRRRQSELHAAAAETPILVVPPKKYDRKRPAPLIIVLHGYGDRPDNYPRLWGGVANDAGAILAVPRGGRQVGRGFGWSGVDEADAVLERILKETGEAFEIDRSRIVVTGFSQGAFIAMALGVRHPELLAGVIPMAGAYIPEIDAPPPPRGHGPRYYFMAGSLDNKVTDMRLAARDFEAAGYPVTLRVLPGIGHVFPRPPGRELGNALGWVLEPQKVSPMAR